MHKSFKVGDLEADIWNRYIIIVVVVMISEGLGVVSGP